MVVDRGGVRTLRAGLLLSLALAQVQAQAGSAQRTVEGRAQRVIDGDSLLFAPADGGRPLEVRLHGIDAPEGCQPWGAEAREALRALTHERALTLRIVARDDHGRWLGRLLHGRTDLGERLVRDGHAWSYRWRHDRGPYVAQERLAQALKRGLHAGGDAQLPRDFRRTHGPCAPP